MPDEERDYHVLRARAELDSAYRSTNRKAIASHLRLSVLHMKRAKRESSAEDVLSLPRYRSSM